MTDLSQTKIETAGGVKYIFTDLKELADYLEEKGMQLRRVIPMSKPRRRELLSSEAAIWEAAAHIVRNSRLEKGKPRKKKEG